MVFIFFDFIDVLNDRLLLDFLVLDLRDFHHLFVLNDFLDLLIFWDFFYFLYNFFNLNYFFDFFYFVDIFDFFHNLVNVFRDLYDLIYVHGFLHEHIHYFLLDFILIHWDINVDFFYFLDFHNFFLFNVFGNLDYFVDDFRLLWGVNVAIDVDRLLNYSLLHDFDFFGLHDFFVSGDFYYTLLIDGDFYLFFHDLLYILIDLPLNYVFFDDRILEYFFLVLFDLFFYSLYLFNFLIN